MSTILSMLVAVAFAGTGQLDGAGMSVADSDLAARIETTFVLNEHLSDLDITTTSTNGEVTLTGVVPTYVQKELAGELARTYGGVTKLKNEIKVDQTIEAANPNRNFRQKVEDKSIGASVRTRVVYRKNLRDLRIRATVINNTVTLTGKVASDFQKEEIGYIAAHTKGVDAVINQLTVVGGGEEGSGSAQNTSTLDPVPAPASTDSVVEQRVLEGIQLDRHLSARRVDVDVVDGICYLSGSVQTDGEQRMAESIAMKTTGVVEVRNHIEVNSSIGSLDEGYLEELEPLELGGRAPFKPIENTGQPLPDGGDTPLFSDDAIIE